ncbi:MAG: SoxR reducing system RseC family protein [Spirochaetia bacterium]
MIEEKASVVEVGPEDVSFRVTGEEACETCDLSEQCYRDGGLIRIPRSELRGLEPEALSPGRMVKLLMEQTSLLGLTGVVYGVPMALFVVGLLLGFYLLFAGTGEAARALGSFGTGVLLVALSWTTIVGLDRRAARRIRYRVEPLSTREDEEHLIYREYSEEK